MKTKISHRFLDYINYFDLSNRRLLILEAQSSIKNPVVWLTCGLHGNELTGIAVIHEVFKIVEKIGLSKGSIFAFPAINLFGMDVDSRRFTPSDEDLNRIFPGKPDGSPGERLTHIVFSEIISQSPQLIIDLHADWFRSVPYVVLDPNYGKVSLEAAQATGLLITKEAEMIENSLSAEILKKGIDAITVELGENNFINEANVNYGIRAILNILEYLGMLPDVTEHHNFDIPKHFFEKVMVYNEIKCTQGGLVRFKVSVNEEVKKGQHVADAYNLFGEVIEKIVNPFDNSIVTGICDNCLVNPSETIIALGSL